eukprot:9980650-Alexandrium_andersonii.AAC.1
MEPRAGRGHLRRKSERAAGRSGALGREWHRSRICTDVPVLRLSDSTLSAPRRLLFHRGAWAS